MTLEIVHIRHTHHHTHAHTSDTKSLTHIRHIHNHTKSHSVAHTHAPECDKYIRISEYIGHEYIFRHSFVSNLFARTYSDIRW